MQFQTMLQERAQVRDVCSTAGPAIMPIEGLATVPPLLGLPVSD